MGIIVPVCVAGCVSLFVGVMLALASRIFQGPNEPGVSRIQQVLPNYDCGACGYSECGSFAKAVYGGLAHPQGCIPGGPKAAHSIGDILGVEVAVQEPRKAVVHCKGGREEALERCIYEGIEDCFGAMLSGNGSKVCSEGCLGLGSCVRACPFGALSINKNGVAVVDNEKCTGCEKCVASCPRQIISMIPEVHKIFLACSNHDQSVRVQKYCIVGCDTCLRCEQTTPSGAVTIENNLPVLDYSKNENFVPAAFKCPKKCFVDLVRVRPKVNIDTKCNGCGECVLVCPVEGAISGQQDKRHVINKDKCIGCGICLHSCPVHAIALWGSLGYGNSATSVHRSAFHR